MAKARDDFAGLVEDTRLIGPPLPELDDQAANALLNLLLRATEKELHDTEGSAHDEAVPS